jgi:holliday junction DNA helicase RuvA
MITRLIGMLDSIEGTSATVTPQGGAHGASPATPSDGVSYEVMLPAYFANRLEERIGQTITFHTRQHLEAIGQGSSFIPRLLGFPSIGDRRFFELFTTVKGLGSRRALRAMAEPPGSIASAITAHDTKALQKLPEIGKRLAETIVAELDGKVALYVPTGLEQAEPKPRSQRGGAASEAVETLVALGETRSEAERKVDLAIARDAELADAAEIVSSAFGG